MKMPSRFKIVFHAMLALSVFTTPVSAFSVSDAPYLWTEHGTRLHRENQGVSSGLNWVLIPGGPGMGSEYLQDFARELKLPGTIWVLDLPGDGSNRLNGRNVDFEQWPQYLTEAVASLGNVVLIGHSFGGFIALSTPQLQGKIRGLVLLNSAPNTEWQSFADKNEKDMPNREQLLKQYEQHHSDAGLKMLAIQLAPYSFQPKSLEKGKKLLENLPYNHKVFDWASENFHPNYKAKWVPEDIPVLILGSESDYVTPIQSFQKDPAFQRSNIKIVAIPKTSHFPWLDNFPRVQQELTEFSDKVSLNTLTSGK